MCSHDIEGNLKKFADFGQSRFDHPDLTNFGRSNFGQSIFGSGVCHGVVPRGWGRRVGPRGVGEGRGEGAPEKVGCPRVGSKISRFVSSLQLPFRSNFGGGV